MIQNVTITSGPVPASSGCACCAAPAEEAGRAASTPTQAVGVEGIQATYAVTGMTCGHCVSTVREELSALSGVTAVEVDLVAGGVSRVSVTSTAALSDDTIAAAVDEAGYALAPLSR